MSLPRSVSLSLSLCLCPLVSNTPHMIRYILLGLEDLIDVKECTPPAQRILNECSNLCFRIPQRVKHLPAQPNYAGGGSGYPFRGRQNQLRSRLNDTNRRRRVCMSSGHGRDMKSAFREVHAADLIKIKNLCDNLHSESQNRIIVGFESALDCIHLGPQCFACRDFLTQERIDTCPPESPVSWVEQVVGEGTRAGGFGAWLRTFLLRAHPRCAC